MTEQINLFEQASKLKLRYKTNYGLVTTEDLWDLPLTSLDEVAKSLNKQVKEAGEESFIEVKSTANEKLELSFEIVKYVIKVKLVEQEAAKLAKENAAKKQQLLELLHQKQNEELGQLSIDEIKNMLAKL